jgi:hypothetical protein
MNPVDMPITVATRIESFSDSQEFPLEQFVRWTFMVGEWLWT